jgi:hypothetical protein
MDPKLIEALAKKLNIDSKEIEIAYNETVKSLEPETKICAYKYVGGPNKGKVCGTLNPKLVTVENNGKWYCKPHNNTINKKIATKSIVKIKNNDSNFVLNTLEDVNKSEQTPKIETYKIGDYVAIKNTLLLVDLGINCCVGKFVDNNPSTVIDAEDVKLLKSLNVDYYRCDVK